METTPPGANGTNSNAQTWAQTRPASNYQSGRQTNNLSLSPTFTSSQPRPSQGATLQTNSNRVRIITLIGVAIFVVSIWSVGVFSFNQIKLSATASISFSPQASSISKVFQI